MEPSTPPPTDTDSASQAATEDLTAATNDWYDAKRLVRAHARSKQDFKYAGFPIQTQGILNELNRSILSRLEKKVTERQLLLTEACEEYTYATDEPPDENTWIRRETKQIISKAEANELLGVFREAGEQWMKDNPDMDGTIVKSIYVAYESVISKDDLRRELYVRRSHLPDHLRVVKNLNE